jgi:hypothetical protein
MEMDYVPELSPGIASRSVVRTQLNAGLFEPFKTSQRSSNHVGDSIMDAEKLSAVLALEDEDDRGWELLQLIKQAPRDDKPEELERFASEIVNPYDKGEAYIEIVGRCTTEDSKLAVHYLEMVRGFSSEAYEFWQPADLLLKIGTLYFEMGDVDRAIQTWNYAVASAVKCIELDPRQDGPSCFGTLSEIAIKFSNAKLTQRAVEIAHLIKIDEIRSCTLEKLQKGH